MVTLCAALADSARAENAMAGGDAVRVSAPPSPLTEAWTASAYDEDTVRSAVFAPADWGRKPTEMTHDAPTSSVCPMHVLDSNAKFAFTPEIWADSVPLNPGPSFRTVNVAVLLSVRRMRPKACCVGVIERKVGEPPVPRSGAETAASTPETLNVAV